MVGDATVICVISNITWLCAITLLVIIRLTKIKGGIYMNFADRLITARKEMGISQELLAEQLGVSRQAVSKWETGESKPDLDNLTALCASLNVTMEYLCFGKEQEAQENKQKKKRSRLVALCIVLPIVAAMLFSTFGYFVGDYIGVAAATEECAETLRQVQYMKDMRIMDALVKYDSNKGEFVASVLPVVAPEGLEVDILITCVGGDGNWIDVRVPCKYEENYFRANLGNLLKQNHSYVITAELRLGDLKTQIPLMLKEVFEILGNGGSSLIWTREHEYVD